MADRDDKIKLSIELDQQAQTQLDAAITRAQASLQRLSTTETTTAQSASKMGSELSAVWDEYTSSVLEAKTATDDLAASTQRASSGGGGLGVTGLRRTGGALTQLGLGDIGMPISRVGEIAQVAKEMDMLAKAAQGATGATEGTIAGLSASTVALGAVAAAGAIFLGGLELIKKAYEGNNAIIQQAISRLDTYYSTIATGDQKSIESKKKQLEAEQADTEKELEQIKNARDNAFTSAQQAYGDLGARILIAAGSTGLYGDTLKDTDAKVAELTKKSADLTGQILGLGDAMTSTEVANKAATNTLLAQADATKARVLEDKADAKLSVDAAKSKADQLRGYIQADEQALEQLEASGDKSDAVKEKIKALTEEQANYAAELDRLNGIYISAAQHAQDLADAEKEHQKTLDNIAKADAEAKKAEEKKQQDTANAVAKYDADLTNITEKGIQDRIAIEHKYQDTLVSIATKAAEQAQDDLTKLGQEREKNAIDANRAEMDANVKAQETEVKLTTDHLNKLEDIRQQARNREAGFILDRNFLGLFQSQLQTRSEMQGENTSFGRAVGDNARQRDIEHQQRLLSYQRANEDTLRNYNIQRQQQAVQQARERQAALLAERTSLTDLQQKITQELTLRRAGIVAELKMIQMGEEQKLQLQKRYLDQATALLSGRSGGYSAPVTAARGVQINQTVHITAADPRQAAQQNALQMMQVIRHVAGAGA